jgi:hypothetical protein
VDTFEPEPRVEVKTPEGVDEAEAAAKRAKTSLGRCCGGSAIG